VWIGFVDWVWQFNSKFHHTAELIPYSKKPIYTAAYDLVKSTINNKNIASMSDSAFRCDLVIVIFVWLSIKHQLATPCPCN
jgi:hypothetical protein